LRVVELRFFGGAAAALPVVPRSRVIDENAAHEARGQRQEMCAILPADAAKVDEPNESLVDESRCLQRVIVTLAAHLDAGETAEFLMNDRDQFVERGTIAAPPCEQ